MSKNHILRNYNDMTDGQLGDFSLHIPAMMTGNANFASQPFTMASLTTAGTSFNTSVGASVNGTPSDTLNKNNLRTALIVSLDTLATYVELTANNDAAKILSSGFNLASTSRTAAVPGMTSIVSVTNVASGKLGLQLAVADNAWCYVVQTSTATNVWVNAGTFTDPHNATLTGLVSGTTYAIRVLVMGSHNQTTEFCDAVSHMAT